MDEEYFIEHKNIYNAGNTMHNPYPYSPAGVAHRISTIRNQLDEDMYIVNPQQIASKVIDIEIALSKSRRLASPAPRHS